MQEREAANLSKALRVQLTEDLGRYLGVPMIHQRVSMSSCKFLLDKANSLSFAGRVTLAQSSLESILGYVLQLTPIPTGGV